MAQGSRKHIYAVQRHPGVPGMWQVFNRQTYETSGVFAKRSEARDHAKLLNADTKMLGETAVRSRYMA